MRKQGKCRRKMVCVCVCVCVLQERRPWREGRCAFYMLHGFMCKRERLGNVWINTFFKITHKQRVISK